MPDHLHLILNPRDGRIIEFTGKLKSLAAKAITKTAGQFQSHTALELMDDLAEDQLHSCKSSEGQIGFFRKGLPLV